MVVVANEASPPHPPCTLLLISCCGPASAFAFLWVEQGRRPVRLCHLLQGQVIRLCTACPWVGHNKRVPTVAVAWSRCPNRVSFISRMEGIKERVPAGVVGVGGGGAHETKILHCLARSYDEGGVNVDSPDFSLAG